MLNIWISGFARAGGVEVALRHQVPATDVQSGTVKSFGFNAGLRRLFSGVARRCAGSGTDISPLRPIRT